jgi:threonylcarbamoyladenosine tRNA methylthiotransferase MtaB
MLVQRGFRRVEFRESADLYVIDTCTVTAEADRKSRKAAGRARRNNPDAVVAVTGCSATYAAAQFHRVVPGALVLPNPRKMELPELALHALQQQRGWAAAYSAFRDQFGSEPVPLATRERAVLKIQDGCNHRCAFCIIPTVRGASVTKPRLAIMAEARAFVREGARELVVTGVSMGDWGHTTNTAGETDGGRPRRGNRELCSLLRALTTIEGLERVRVSSLDPADVDEQFLQTVGHTPKLCPHIHLALQGGSAATLRRMRRRYTPELFLRVARRWREIRPGGGLTTDIIVGFPGETSEDFEGSLRIARGARFSAIHVFPYSPREGTVAAGLPDQVPPAEQNRRVDALLQLAQTLAAEYAVQFIGQVLPVLVEQVHCGVAEGLTPQYLKARVALSGAAEVGDVLWLQAQAWHDGVLSGQQVERCQEPLTSAFQITP